MNTELVAKIIADAIRITKSFAGQSILLPTDDLQEEKSNILVNVTAYDEIIEGNATYRMDAEILIRKPWADINTKPLIVNLNAMHGDISTAFLALAGANSPASSPIAWHIIRASVSPAETSTLESLMVYTFKAQIFIQF